MKRDMEQFVESVLCEVDAKAAAKRMDMVLSAINELRKVTSKDRKVDKEVRSLEDHAKKIASIFNQRM